MSSPARIRCINPGLLSALALAGLALSAAPAHAAPPSSGSALARPDVAVPEALRPWVDWALHGSEDALCPVRDGSEDARRCVWPARLQLALDDRGGRFTQVFRVYRRSFVPLPGDDKRWPVDVRVGGQPALVVPADEDDEGGGGPRVLLPPGDHQVTGSFAWDALPESLHVPAATGLLALSVRGSAVAQPSRDAQGELWLHKEAEEKEADVLEMSAHRKVTDGIPLALTTRIELRVSGSSREVLLGRTLPPGFVPMSIETPLPARLEPDSRLRLQVRPGTWVVTLTARREGPAKELGRPSPDGPWAAGDEVWAFEAQPELRLVTVEGVLAIDPQQTTLPDDWKRLPCYPMRQGDVMRLVEQRRGDAEPAPDRLSLVRELWLDFGGEGYTVTDRISGTLHRAWRLEMNPPTELGRVAVGGKDQFITRIAGQEKGRAGVEVRQGTVQLSADSRIVGDVGLLPAVSWDVDFHQVEGRLHLPPGWRLVHASGADEVPGTWVRRWSLLDLFLLLVTAMAIGRLYGLGWGVLGLLALALALPEEDAPRWVWLVVLAVEAVARLVPEGRIRQFLGWLRLGVRVTLLLIVIGFAVDEVRAAIYPALERDTDDSSGWLLAKGEFAPAAAPVQQTLAEAPAPEPVAASAEESMPSGSVEADGAGAPPQVQAPASPVEEKTVMGKKRRQGSLDRLAKGEEGVLGQMLSDSRSPPRKLAAKRKYLEEYDPQAVVQTGPGLPRWSWTTVALSWNGPVDRAQLLRLYLVPPWANLLLALLRVLLCALVALRLLGLPQDRLAGLGRLGQWLGEPRVGTGMRSGAALVLILGSLFFPGRAARAELPPKELLDELRGRLLEAPACRPRCVSSPRLVLEVTPRRLRARLEVVAAARTAVPLPGSAAQWTPESVLVDGQPAAALGREEDGHLYLALEPGSHQVLLDGELAARDTVQIALPLRPHRVEARTEGWRLEGLHEDGLADENLQLTRVVEKGAGNAASLQPGALPSFVRVHRSLRLGLLWEMDTRVERLTPAGTAVVLEVPLLGGESVTTPEVRVQGGKALVNMGPGSSEVSWHSLLAERPAIELEAPTGLPWVEVWQLEVSPVWHVELQGIPVVHQGGEGLRLPTWQPWPGEKVTVNVSRPAGVTGQTLTIDRSEMQVRPGLRATDVQLVLELRSSRGAQHLLTLPEGAVLQSVSIDGRTQPLRPEGRVLRLPIHPGAERVELAWREGRGISTLFRTPVVDLGSPSVNATIIVEPGRDRWTLALGGPRLGPAVLFWGLGLVLVLVSLGLGRVPWTPLGAGHWLLLLLGLSQIPLPAAAVVAGWLLCLGWRNERPALGSWALFNLRQLVLVGWSVAALAILVVAIHEGLLGHPDMQIEGNGSSSGHLVWFQDRAQAELPRAFVLSVPLVAYRLAMLLWALWMARALLAWLRWGWGAMGRGGWWRRVLRPLPVTPASMLGKKPWAEETAAGAEPNPTHPADTAAARVATEGAAEGAASPSPLPAQQPDTNPDDEGGPGAASDG